ncbi:MAG: glycosyltransferase [Chryseolinea sp.]
MARILERKSFKVVFAGVGFFQEHVRRNGFEFYPLKSVPFGLGFERWSNTTKRKRNLYFSCLKDRITDRLHDEREKDLQLLLQELKPDVLLIDGTQATDFIILYPLLRGTSIKVAVIHAMFPTYVVKGRPPVNSASLPENETAVAAAIRSLKAQQTRKSWGQRLLYVWHDDRYIIDRAIKRSELPQKYRSEVLGLFYYNIAGVTEFVLSPREFDFPTFDVPANQFFTGFMMNPVQHDFINDDYMQVRALLKDELAENKTRLLYCSFGTIESAHNDAITEFLNKLITVTEILDYRLIISTGSQKDKKIKLRKSDHVYCFQSVPQTDVLTYTNVFITHGGLSSIKEAIHASVPMLMYPVHGDYDPMGNAARVAYHGLGLRGDAVTDTESEIVKKIQDLIDDKRFVQNVNKMRNINLRYTATKFLSLFSKLAPVN